VDNSVARPRQLNAERCRNIFFNPIDIHSSTLIYYAYNPIFPSLLAKFQEALIRLPVFGHLGSGEPTVKPAYEGRFFVF
jgi:hypothetical protein